MQGQTPDRAANAVDGAVTLVHIGDKGHVGGVVGLPGGVERGHHSRLYLVRDSVCGRILEQLLPKLHAILLVDVGVGVCLLDVGCLEGDQD